MIGLFILITFSFGVKSSASKTKSEAMLACYHAELSLRLADATNLLQSTSRESADKLRQEDSFPASVPAQDLISKLGVGKASQLALSAKHTLERVDQDLPFVLIRKIILEGELNPADTNEDLKRLAGVYAKTKEKNTVLDIKLLQIIQSMYASNVKQPANMQPIQLAENVHIIEKNLPPGWFRERALFRFYKSNNLSKNYQDLLVIIKDKTWSFVLRLAVFGIVVIALTLVGLAVIIWRICFFKGKANLGDPLAVATRKAKYGWNTVLLVFCAWFFTQIVFSMVFSSLKKASLNLGPDAGSSFIRAVYIALIYLLSNGPALLYIYFFALRPEKVSLQEGINFRFRNGAGSLATFFGSGLLAWFSAIPLVIFAFFLSVKFFNASGSTNPIIVIVIQAAQSHNLFTILLFYFILGVLAPFVEESLFRGFFYSFLRTRYNFVFANVLSASLFAIAHLDPGSVLPLFCLGSIFAYLFEITGSTVPSIVAHGLWNSGTFTLILILFGS